MRKLALIALLAVTWCMSAPRMSAQRMMGPPHFGAAHSAGGFGAGRGAFARSFAYPIPFFSDGYYSDALYDSGYPVAPQPNVIIMQAPSREESAAARFPVSAQPLLIELQGDHYVRVSGEDNSGAKTIEKASDRMPADNMPARQGDVAVAATHRAMQELPPTVLIFRDGRREEVSDYTIADGVLYARGNYYVDGSWNRKIELSSLNLPETFDANRSRGVRFQLPSAPNEVIVGP
jgi:hypothetical protein